MALSDAEALKMDRSAAADVLCGCAFCIPATARKRMALTVALGF